MKVGDVMSKDILLVSPGDGAMSVGSLLDSRQVGAAAVVEDGSFRGIISKETFVANLDKVCERPLESLKASDLMEEDVDSLEPEDNVMKGVDMLLTQKGFIDRVPVISGGQVAGFLSKMDMTALYTSHMRDRFKVGDLMHYSPSTVYDYTPLGEVIEEIKRSNIKRVLVLSGDNLVGIISVRDLSMVLFRKGASCSQDPDLKAEDVMTRNPVTASRKMDAAQVAKIMVDKRIGGVPILLNNGIEGILSRTDLLKGFQILGV